MYGAGLPALFVIALVSLVIFYIQEKVALAYYFKSPPAYDEKLGMVVLKVLNFAPVLFCLFGYWMLSNPEIFDN